MRKKKDVNEKRRERKKTRKKKDAKEKRRERKKMRKKKDVKEKRGEKKKDDVFFSTKVGMRLRQGS